MATTTSAPTTLASRVEATTRATTPAPTVATPPLPTTTIVSTGAESPAEAAQGLYDAWASGSITTARRFGTPTAVNELFGDPGGGMSFYACHQTAQDLFDCVFMYAGGALHMHVYGDYVNGHLVEDIEYSFH